MWPCLVWIMQHPHSMRGIQQTNSWPANIPHRGVRVMHGAQGSLQMRNGLQICFYKTWDGGVCVCVCVGRKYLWCTFMAFPSFPLCLPCHVSATATSHYSRAVFLLCLSIKSVKSVCVSVLLLLSHLIVHQPASSIRDTVCQRSLRA